MINRCYNKSSEKERFNNDHNYKKVYGHECIQYHYANITKNTITMAAQRYKALNVTVIKRTEYYGKHDEQTEKSLKP